MDSDFAARFSILSKRLQSRSDLYLERGGEEFDGDEECLPEFLCPFCAEDFDVVGLCCHIEEEHPVEVKNGVCPVCAKRVGMDIVSHITMQHGNFFKVQRRRRFRRGGSNSTFSILRKELREGNLQSIFGGSSRLVSSSNSEPDPLLSFMYNAPVVDEPVVIQPDSPAEASVVKKSSDVGLSESRVGTHVDLTLLIHDVALTPKSLNCQIKNKKRRQGGASSSKGYCFRQFLAYENHL